MQPLNIFLVRHGQSIANVDKSIYKTTPDWKVELTDKGQEQAKQAAEKIRQIIKPKPTNLAGDQRITLYCSPWYRARQTAALIRYRFDYCKYYEDPRLREQEWGNFQEDALSLKINKERYKFGTFFYRMPHGESGADVYDRISTFLETLYRDFKNEHYPNNTVIVSHGLTIRIFLMRWFHWTVEEFEALDNLKNGEVILIKYNMTLDKYELMTPLRRQ